MTLELREHPNARAELFNAAIWYDQQSPGLGDKFLDAIDDALQNILVWPYAAPEFSRPGPETIVRNMPVRLFPYRVLYCVTESTVLILAYAHQKRRPLYWQARL